MGLLDMILGGRRGGLGGVLGGIGGGGKGRLLMALLPVVLQMLANRQRGGGRGPGAGGVLGGIGGLGGLGGGLGALAGIGGLGALLQQMSDRGFGDHAQSWVGTGANQPLPADAVDQLFDRQQLGEIASASGLSHDETREGLTELLPEVVDHLTPGGQLPDDDRLLASIDDFERQLQDDQ